MNYLRSLALNKSRTDWVFLTDADLIPSEDLHPHFKKLLSTYQILPKQVHNYVNYILYDMTHRSDACNALFNTYKNLNFIYLTSITHGINKEPLGDLDKKMC